MKARAYPSAKRASGTKAPVAGGGEKAAAAGNAAGAAEAEEPPMNVPSFASSCAPGDVSARADDDEECAVPVPKPRSRPRPRSASLAAAALGALASSSSSSSMQRSPPQVDAGVGGAWPCARAGVRGGVVGWRLRVEGRE